MNRVSGLAWVYLAYCGAWPLALFVVLDEAPETWEMVILEATVFIALLGGAIEFRLANSTSAMLAFLLIAVLSGISAHALYYMQVGLVETDTGQVFFPAWPDALYFSVVTFTTLGYGDMVPREEYRLVSAFQAIYGYVFLGAFVGTLVAMVSGPVKAPHR